MRQEEVLELVRRYPDFTVRELAEAYTVGDFVSGEKMQKYRGLISGILRRLEKYHIVERAEVKVKDKYGRPRIDVTWRLSE